MMNIKIFQISILFLNPKLHCVYIVEREDLV